MMVKKGDGEDMKRILLVLTGGTIGSRTENGIISTDKGSVRVLEMYKEAFPECDTCFDIAEPFEILSENLELKCWERLIRTVTDAELSLYDGIIITHGSDTLSYSSAMLGMCLHGLGLPVVITAADLVPDDERSNALSNFSAAVSLVGMASDGVYTVYQNKPDTAPRVFVPTRITEADRFQDRFGELGDLPEMRMVPTNGGFALEGGETLKKLEGRKKRLELTGLRFDKKVMLIHPYPSADAEMYEPDENTGAALIVTYHSGTAPESFCPFIRKCRKKDIPVFLCSMKRGNSAMYESSSTLIENGAVPMYDTGTESAYAKLLLAVNLCPEDIGGFVERDAYFEELT